MNSRHVRISSTSASIEEFKRSRFETLDGLRGVGALCVMSLHYFSGRGLSFLSNTALAVDLFFMLSGFVIAHSYGERLRSGMSTWSYLAKRFIRLYPFFLIGQFLGVLSVAILKVGGHTSGSFLSFAKIFALNLIYLPSFDHITIDQLAAKSSRGDWMFPFNPPSWSLFFEVVASVAFVGLCRLGKRCLLVMVITSFVVFVICGLVHSFFSNPHEKYVIDFAQGWNPSCFFGGFPRVFFSFSFGLLLYSLRADDSLRAPLVIIKNTVGHPIILYLLLFIVLIVPLNLRGLYPAFVLIFASPFLVLSGSIVQEEGSLSRAFTRFLGRISYPTYCLHWPIGNLFLSIVNVNSHLSVIVALLLSVLTTICASIILTSTIDETIRLYLSKLTLRVTAT